MNVSINHFEELSKKELYALLKLRAEVFVVEQNCPYVDPDGLDDDAFHVMGYQKEVLVAYARILKPSAYYKEPSIGRVIAAESVRNQGLGKEIFKRSMHECDRLFPNRDIRIMAQVYLVRFYEYFGFQVDSDEFLEDGIPHVEMIARNS